MNRSHDLAMVALVAAFIWSVGLILALWLATYQPQPDWPHCPEDAVLIGAGDYDNGRWSVLTCGPAVDDYR